MKSFELWHGDSDHEQLNPEHLFLFHLVVAALPAEFYVAGLQFNRSSNPQTVLSGSRVSHVL